MSSNSDLRKPIFESCSCDDLEIIKENQNNSNTKSQITRSQSWSSIERNEKALGKPPLPPHPLSGLERRRAKVAKSKSLDAANKKLKCIQTPLSTLNSSKLIYNQDNSLELSTSMNGKSYNWKIVDKEERDHIFKQAQKDIDTLLARLEYAYESRLQSHSMYNCIDIEKYTVAKEALSVESKQFVTASKLFVQHATDLSPLIIDHLFECLTFLERMFDIAESVVVHLDSEPHISCLVDRMKEAAATYSYTVDTIHKLSNSVNNIDDAVSSPYMAMLMSHAASLATSLSALTRTLRNLP